MTMIVESKPNKWRYSNHVRCETSRTFWNRKREYHRKK